MEGLVGNTAFLDKALGHIRCILPGPQDSYYVATIPIDSCYSDIHKHTPCCDDQVIFAVSMLPSSENPKQETIRIQSTCEATFESTLFLLCHPPTRLTTKQKGGAVDSGQLAWTTVWREQYQPLSCPRWLHHTTSFPLFVTKAIRIQFCT